MIQSPKDRLGLVGFSRSHLLLVFFAAALAYVPLGATYAARGEPNSDEGFYAYASYAVFHGQVPYRDFGYTQEPLLPYLQGAVLSVTGFGVRQERWLNVTLSALSLGLAAVLWSRAGLPARWRILLVLGWCLSKSLVYFDSLGKTYALSGALLVSASFFLLPGRSVRMTPRGCALALLCVLAIGCRLTTAPAALGLGAAFVMLYRDRVRLPLILGTALLSALLLIVPFYALDPVNAFFWTWKSHVMTLAEPRHLGTLAASGLLAPAAAALGVAGLVLAAFGALKRSPAADEEGVSYLKIGGCILGAGLAGWVIPPFLSGVYAEYAVPAIPLVWIGSGILAADALRRKPQAEPSSRRGISWKETAGYAFLVGILVADLLLGPGRILPGYLDAIDDAAAAAAQFSQRDDTLLTSMPEVALAAGRRPVPRLESGNFGVTGEMSPKQAADLHMLPFSELCDLVAQGKPRIVVLFALNPRANFGWSLPSMRLIPESWMDRFQRALASRYEKVHSNAFFIVLRARDAYAAPLNP